MLLVAIGAPLGHPARSLGCNRPLRTLRSRRTRPDTHEIPLLCGRRQRQLFCSRGPPAAEGVEARGGRGGGVRHVLHGIGSVASVGPKGRHAGSPRQVAPAGAGAVLRRAGCRNGLSLGRRSCDGARATSSVSHPSWAVIDAWQWNGSRPSSEITMGRAKLDRQGASSCPAARRLTLSRYVARLKPRCGSLSLSLSPITRQHSIAFRALRSRREGSV